MGKLRGRADEEEFVTPTLYGNGRSWTGSRRGLAYSIQLNVVRRHRTVPLDYVHEGQGMCSCIRFEIAQPTNTVLSWCGYMLRHVVSSVCRAKFRSFEIVSRRRRWPNDVGTLLLNRIITEQCAHLIMTVKDTPKSVVGNVLALCLRDED